MTLTAPKGGDDITKSGPKSKANAANNHQAAPPITNSAVFRGLQIEKRAIFQPFIIMRADDIST